MPFLLHFDPAVTYAIYSSEGGTTFALRSGCAYGDCRQPVPRLRRAEGYGRPGSRAGVHRCSRQLAATRQTKRVYTGRHCLPEELFHWRIKPQNRYGCEGILCHSAHAGWKIRSLLEADGYVSGCTPRNQRLTIISFDRKPEPSARYTAGACTFRARGLRG
jgi:hypothetical protein